MPKDSRKKSRLGPFLVLVVLLLIGVFVATRKITPVLWNVLFNREIQLKKTNGNINILLLGIGGGNHDGPNLSDTIIFVSANPDRNKVSMVSIPRDLWIPDINGKINTAYAIGKDKSQDGGLILAKAVVSRVTGQEINYGVVIDFDGFVKAVDLLGGLDINVDHTFDDYQYPVESKYSDLCGHTLEEATALLASQSATQVFPCRYEHLHFDAGMQHMDGVTALKYVRSRYAVGDEGTDFARSRRQQKVIAAFREKALSLGILLNPIKILNLYTVLSSSIDTDIPQDQFDDFIKVAQVMKGASIHSAVIDQGDATREGLLINPPLDQFNGSWVLIPKAGNGNYTDIKNFISCTVISNSCSTITPTPAHK